MLMPDLHTGMANKVTIYVPGTTNIDQIMDETAAKKAVERVELFLMGLFGGGVSSHLIMGTFPSSTGRSIKEPVTLVYSFAHELLPTHRETIFEFCKQLRDDLGQDAIGLEINDIFYLV
jgi:hypothetical protein